MNFKKAYFYSLIAPFMILISILGFNFRKEKPRILYLPLGIIGIYLMIEKKYQRISYRKNVLQKIKLFYKNK
tara:strand:+ start:626 stop:841 length:216 start_codon:yes stop_codon:yes gene_type:complete